MISAFFIYVSNLQICVISFVHPARQPVILGGTNVEHSAVLCVFFFNQILLYLLGTIELYQFMPLSATLTLAEDSRGQQEAKSDRFSLTSELMRLRFSMMLKQTEHLDISLTW